MNRKTLVLSLAIAATLAGVLTSGCRKSKEVTGAEKRKILERLQPAAEYTIQGFEEGNYAKFTRDFSAEAKQKFPEQKFATSRQVILSRIGRLKSKKISKVLTQDNLTALFYAAEFERASVVEIRVTFITLNGKDQVNGYWVDAPQLR